MLRFQSFRVDLPLLSLLLCCCLTAESITATEAVTAVERGEYIFNMAGCASCHTNSEEDGEPLAGGVELKTPFGIFYGSNISTDKQYGIGNWSDADFIRALKQGISPKGEHYYPAFPYTSFSLMTEQDLLDLKAYLDVQPAVATPSKPHKLAFPLEQRSLLVFWKWLNFSPQGFVYNKKKPASWNRGAYIVKGPGHCSQCHTPRNITGGLDQDLFLAGSEEGLDGDVVPALRTDLNSDLAQWQSVDLTFVLETGLKPDGDTLERSMAHVVENSTSHLHEQDLQAIADFLLDVSHP
ncbi:MAG: cytochrome c [Motiliproteus sp.]